jgi:CubicO group peptidase (beta-lactamase class C family)
VGRLVHHTSGLPDDVELLDADDTEVTTAADAIAVLQGSEGDEPGTRFGYSNTNYFLLGQIVEEVEDEGGAGYGGGIVLDELDGEVVLRHGGSWLGYASSLEVRPADHLAVAVAGNIDDLDAELLGEAIADTWAR